MSTKSARNIATDDAACLWYKEAKTALETGDIAKVNNIMNELRILTTVGQSSLDSLTAQIGIVIHLKWFSW